MAGKVKFDRDATFKQIIGADREPEVDSQDIDKALRRMALEEEKNLTEVVNEILRVGLERYF